MFGFNTAGKSTVVILDFTNSALDVKTNTFIVENFKYFELNPADMLRDPRIGLTLYKNTYEALIKKYVK